MIENQKLPALSKTGFKLFSLGFITLFLELALIRYLSGNIWNLGYFPNLVLIAAFIGMGIGFSFHHFISENVSKTLYRAVTLLLLGLVAYIYIAHPSVPGFSQFLGDIGGDLYFTVSPTKDSNSLLSFIIYMLAIIIIFACLSQATAKCFRQFSPLSAYTLDIGGSCLGIIIFMLLSWLTIPAMYWFILFAIFHIIAATDTSKAKYLSIIPSLIVVILVYQQDTQFTASPEFKDQLEVHWSPYQKVEYINSEKYYHRIYVNGIQHQFMEKPEDLKNSFYQHIHNARTSSKNLPAYKKILIIGAGSGNDVSNAIVNGAEHIDAVEIDPIIAELGKKYNPNRPYQDPKVHLHIDDGRSFMSNTQNKYDLIIFALTDSVVKVSSMSQLRLENYLFTVESVKKAYSLLNENGDITFYNSYRTSWLRSKIEKMIVQATGNEPKELFRDGNIAVLSVRKSTATPNKIATNDNIDITIDDWPFLYLKAKAIPNIYIKAMIGMCGFAFLFMLLLHFLTRKNNSYNKSGMLYIKLSFVFMGVAFLLLETKSIIQFSLLFGTTWINNSLVFLAILLLVLAANWAATCFKNINWLWIIFPILLLSTLLIYVIPLEKLLEIDNLFLRFILASLITFTPIFFANLIFSISFRNQKIAEHIFGWNLIGATLGGIAEYFSLAYGYNFLALLVSACYLMVFILLYIGQSKLKKVH
ncbi:hypothetical protein BVY03_03450 [bacterium K02(2017)]|nr:hypothetical protein BVY03_03450 [bacterium K02(2017)]